MLNKYIHNTEGVCLCACLCRFSSFLVDDTLFLFLYCPNDMRIPLSEHPAATNKKQKKKKKKQDTVRMESGALRTDAAARYTNK